MKIFFKIFSEMWDYERYKFLIITILVIYHILGIVAVRKIDTQYFLEKSKPLKNSNGPSLITPVSVILQGNKPQLTDAIGKPIPKPVSPLQVASPINLLNPDRYEFYTFDESGELVKRLMTIKEIQSIVANGDADNIPFLNNMKITEPDPEKNIHDIIASVQNVLTKEVEWKKNSSTSSAVLDTPDVSASWSMILPTIFSNTGGEIFSSRPQVLMTPDTYVVEGSKKGTTTATSYIRTTQKPKFPTTQKFSTKRPTVIRTTEIPQKTFINNQEVIKPVYNTVDLNLAKVTTKTTTKPVLTTFSYVGKPKPTLKISTPSTIVRKTTKPTLTEIISTSLGHKTTTNIIKQSQSTRPFNYKISSTTPNTITTSYKVSSTSSSSSVAPPSSTVLPKIPFSTSLPSKIWPSSTTSFKIPPSTALSSKIWPSSTALPSRIPSSTTLPSKIWPSSTTSFKIPPSIALSSKIWPSSTALPSRIPSSTTSPSKIWPSSTISSKIPPSIALSSKIWPSSTALPSRIPPSTTLPSKIWPSSTAPSTTSVSPTESSSTTTSIPFTVPSSTATTSTLATNKISTQWPSYIEHITEPVLSTNVIPTYYFQNASTLTHDIIQLSPEAQETENNIQILLDQTVTDIRNTSLSSDATDINESMLLLHDNFLQDYNKTSYEEKNDSLEDVENESSKEVIETTQHPNDDIISTEKIELSEKVQNNEDTEISGEIQNNEQTDLSEEVQNNEKLDFYENIQNNEKTDLSQEIQNIENSDFSETVQNNDSFVHFNNIYTETEATTLMEPTTVTTEFVNLLQEKDTRSDNPIVINNILSNVLSTTKPLVENYFENLTNNSVEQMNETESTTITAFDENTINPTMELTTDIGENKASPTSSLLLHSVTSESTNEIISTTTPILDSNIQKGPSYIESENSIEIEALLSDVLSQITDPPATVLPVKTHLLESNQISNRFSNFAQINTMLASEFNQLKGEDNDDDNEKPLNSINYESSDLTQTTKDVIEFHDKLTTNEPWQTSLNDMNIIQTTTTEKLDDDQIQEESYISSNTNENNNSDEIKRYENNNNVVDNFEFSTKVIEQEDNDKIDTTIASLIQKTATQKSDDNTLEDHTTLKPQLLSEIEENNSLQFNNYSEDSNENGYLPLDDLISITDIPQIPTSSSNTNSLHDLLQSKFSNTNNVTNLTETDYLYAKLGESTEIINDLSGLNIESLAVQNDFSKNENDYLDLQTTLKPIANESEQKIVYNESQMQFPETTTSSENPSFSTVKPVQYHKQPNVHEHELMLFMKRPASRLPIIPHFKVSHSDQVIRMPINHDESHEFSESTNHLSDDMKQFIQQCNELGFNYWKSITSDEERPTRSLLLSPFALTSVLSMVFLGARGNTSGEMNEVLKLDDMITFNPHLILKNITDSVERSNDVHIASAAFLREIFSDKSNGKILQFFKEKVHQLYSAHIQEVDFNVSNDFIRRKTNQLIKKRTMGRVTEYIKTNNVWVNAPLAIISANLFETNCSEGSTHDKDGEIFFQVQPSLRQRRLVPLSAIVFRSGFTAGYDPVLDATAVALGSVYDTVSTIFLMPGQQGSIAPNDNIERLEKSLLDDSTSKISWKRLLTYLAKRPGLELQLPRFSHRSFINASSGLQKLGLKALFNSQAADLRGLTGTSHKDSYISDILQINTFSTCAGDRDTDNNLYSEVYPPPPLKRFNSGNRKQDEELESVRFAPGLMLHNNARAIHDDLLDPKYLELPLPLRPRQARVSDVPRLRFDKPFMYFVRHNPTGMVLFMGRFNPKLLP